MRGDVKVVTTGTGQLAWLKNVENKVESVPIWLAVDQRLKVMFARAYKADE